MKIHWKYFAMALVIGWFAGAASGLLISHLCHSSDLYGKHSPRMRERFYKQLQLTPDQRTRVDAILQISHQKLDQIFSTTKPQVEAVRDATRMQIRQLLSPEQKMIFDKLKAERDARFKNKMDQMQKREHEWHL